MTTFELFANSIILAAIIGALISAVILNVRVVRPLTASRDEYRRRLINAEARLAQRGRHHPGTPYLESTRRAAERADVLALMEFAQQGIATIDDHNGSRRAPQRLEVVR